MQDNPHHWMRLALSVASQAMPVDVPVGCLVIDQGQIIGSAYNCRERDANPAGHAEVVALTQAARHRRDWRLTGCILVVTLEPCPMCAALIQQARISQVIYGASDPLQGACGSRYTLWQGETLAGIEEAACQHLLTQFFNKTRRNAQ